MLTQRTLRQTIRPWLAVAALLVAVSVAPARAGTGDEVTPGPEAVVEGRGDTGVAGDRGVTMHLRLLRSAPAADSTVSVAPRELRLWFSQRPELALTSARITMGSHTVATSRASLGGSSGEGVLVILPIAGRLEPGVNQVAWRTMAPDGHVVSGEFSFTLAPSGRASGG